MVGCMRLWRCRVGGQSAGSTAMATPESPLWGEDEVAEEELRLLEAMAAVSTSMQQFNQVLGKLNKQTVDLSRELATAERQLNALYLPFQAAIYEMQGERRKTQGTPAPPSRRTEL